VPLLAVGLLGGAVGTGLEVAGNIADKNAINSAEASTYGTLNQDQQKATAVMQQQEANQGAGVANNDIQSGAAQRNALSQVLQQAAQPASGTPLPASTADTAVRGATARTGNAGNAWSNIVNKAQDVQGGYGDWQTALNLGNQNTNQQLGVINTEARGTAGLLPLEVQAASHAGDALSGWGSIVSALGQVASLGAATGAFAPAAAAGSPSITIPTDAEAAAAKAAAANMVDWSNP
jgi:hypothetical protein